MREWLIRPSHTSTDYLANKYFPISTNFGKYRGAYAEIDRPTGSLGVMLHKTFKHANSEKAQKNVDYLLKVSKSNRILKPSKIESQSKINVSSSIISKSSSEQSSKDSFKRIRNRVEPKKLKEPQLCLMPGINVFKIKLVDRKSAKKNVFIPRPSLADLSEANVKNSDTSNLTIVSELSRELEEKTSEISSFNIISDLNCEKIPKCVGELSNLKIEQLRLEEHALYQHYRDLEIQKYRYPIPYWYESKGCEFNKEAHKNLDVLKNEEHYESLQSYVKSLKESTENFKSALESFNKRSINKMWNSNRTKYLDVLQS